MQLTRLVMLLGISPAIIPPIVDWLDPDSIESEGGAEADYYMRLMPPYEPRNGPMPTLGDLRLVKGIDDATFMKLRNYLTVAPEPAVNINTAPPEVLACLDQSLSDNPKIMQQIIEARAIRPFSNVTDVLNLIGGAASQGTSQGSLTQNLTTRTTYFSITGMGAYAGARKMVFATFRRNGDGTGALTSWQEE
jgi:general secretion pathway protein K